MFAWRCGEGFFFFSSRRRHTRCELVTGVQTCALPIFLDEPSIGLHQRDNDRLLATLKRLRDLGNTVIVVEHDEDAIRHADYVVDMGPGAGVHGGEIVAEGTLKQVLKNKSSLTAAYLTGAKRIEVPAHRRPGNGFDLVLKGARANNLRGVTARSEEHTSELQSLMRISYAVFCLKKKKTI